MAARSCGASHAPPVHVLNCVPPTQSRCPSVHGLSSVVELVEVAAAAADDDVVEIATAEEELSGEGVMGEVTGVLEVNVAAEEEGRAAVVVVAAPTPPVVWPPPVVAEGSCELPPLGAAPLLRGLPSQGWGYSSSPPLGWLTELPGDG